MMFEAVSRGMYVPGAYEMCMQGIKNYPWLFPLIGIAGIAIIAIFIIVLAKKSQKS